MTPDGEHNVWFVGDDAECVVIDPAGDLGDLIGYTELRRLRAILWTSLSPESVGVAVRLADLTQAVTYLPADDLAIWRRSEPERRPQSPVPRGLVLKIGGLRLESIHTPGLTPGTVCWYAPSLSAVFTGDTLVAAGPGGWDLVAAARSTLIASIRGGLFSLPSGTVVHPGKGKDTRIGTQRWDARLRG